MRASRSSTVNNSALPASAAKCISLRKSASAAPVALSGFGVYARDRVAIVLEQALDPGKLRFAQDGIAGCSSKFMVQLCLAVVVQRGEGQRKSIVGGAIGLCHRLLDGEIAVLDADGKGAAPGARRPGMGQRRAGIDQIGLCGKPLLARDLAIAGRNAGPALGLDSRADLIAEVAA